MADDAAQQPGFMQRMRVRWSAEPSSSGVNVSRDLDLRPAPLDQPPASGDQRWWSRRGKKTSTVKVWDLIYGLQAQEAAIGTEPTEIEVEVMVMNFRQTASRLEALGESDKANDIVHILLPSFLQRPEVQAVLSSGTVLPSSTAGPMPGALPEAVQEPPAPPPPSDAEGGGLALEEPEEPPTPRSRASSEAIEVET
mgnify:CR=1 FL=1|tara:strand:- start:1581 stop:2168 length:588 start_codon:yes stop_codon:yes gene_type:complete